MTIFVSTSIIAVFVVFLLSYLPLYGKRQWPIISLPFTLIIAAFLIVASVYSPIGGDKGRYLQMFHDASYLKYLEDTDVGWVVLTKFLNNVCSDNEILYLFIIAIIYVFGYYLLGKNKLGKERIAYYLLLSASCIGFWGGSTNIMRAGTATAIFFFSLCKEEKSKFWYILFSIAAILVHNSVIILVAGFFLTKYFRNIKLLTWIWIIFLILSAANTLDPIVSFLAENTGDIGDRYGSYAYSEDESVKQLYHNAGFRIEFIIYSAYAIIYSLWIILKRKYNDVFYARIVCTYIIVNCLWLTVIRIFYADRFALLSWSLISLILLYPYMNPKNRLKFDTKIITAAFIPVIVNLILTISAM